MKYRHLVIFVAMLLALPAFTLAEEGIETSKEDDPFFKQRGINDKASITIGVMGASATTTAQIDSDYGIGTTLLLEEIFNLPTSRDYARFSGYYRFTRHHRIDFTYMGMSGEGTDTLFEREITVGDTTFEINAQIGAKESTRFGSIQYRYAFVNNGRAEAGLIAGIGIIDTSLEVFGSIGLEPGPVYIATERAAATIPLPVAGVYTDFTLTRRLFLSVEGLLFSAGYGDYDGNISDVRMALRWYPSKIFGFGLALNRTRIDVDIERNNGTVSLDYLLDGPSVFVTFAIPGLK